MYEQHNSRPELLIEVVRPPDRHDADDLQLHGTRHRIISFVDFRLCRDANRSFERKIYTREVPNNSSSPNKDHIAEAETF